MPREEEVRSGRRPLRVAFFTDTFPPTHDGVACVTGPLAAALQRRGIEVTVHTVRTPGTSRLDRLPTGVRVHRHTAFPAPGYPEYRIALLPYAPILQPSFAREYDLVHIHTPGFVGLAGWLAARRARVPILSTYHTHLAGMLTGAGTGPASRRFYAAWGRFAADLCASSDLATAPTSAALGLLAGASRSPPRRPPAVVENGVDPALFRPGVAEPDWPTRLGAVGSPMVTFLGRLTNDKGVLRFLEAVAALPQQLRFVAVVGGTGPLDSEVRRRLGAWSGASGPPRYLGAVAEAEKPALLAQSRIFVLPSLSDTSSVALLEAMASGAACVVSDRGGPGEIARASGGCLTIDSSDPASIAVAVARLLADPAETERLGRRGRGWVVANGSIDRTAARFAALYASLLDGPAGASSSGRSDEAASSAAELGFPHSVEVSE